VLLVVVVLTALGYLTVRVSTAMFSASTSSTASFGSTDCFYRATTQNGTASNATNGTTTVTITAVDPTKAFLMFTSRHNSNRPVGSALRGRIASATSIEFVRVTDEGSPTTIGIEWSVVEYNCGIRVQRGSAARSSTAVDVPITAVASVAQSFVTWSTTPAATDVTWSNNDPILAQLTSTTNLQFRTDVADASHVIWWEVIEFLDPTIARVQHGTLSLAAPSTSTTVTLPSAVDLNKAFVLTGTHSSGDGTDIGSGLIRARLTGASTITIDRSVANYDITEISWQVVELLDGSAVQRGTTTLASGTATTTAALTPVTLSRTTVFTSAHTGSGQNGGRTSYTADDVIGVGAVGAKLTTTTQITLTRNNTSANTDVAWFVVSWGIP
jgi:hypothetical protein